MNSFSSVAKTAEKWHLSKRRVQVLCSENRIDGAVKQSGVWLIPKHAKKPPRLTPGKKSGKTAAVHHVLSLFSGCGGMDLGFEGDFRVLDRSVNKAMHKDWISQEDKNGWVRLRKTCFHTVFANDIKPEARATWVNYFGSKGINASTYCLQSIVDLVKLEKENKFSIFPSTVDIVTGGFPCQDFSIAGKRLGFDSDTGHNGKKMRSEAPNTENRGHLYIWMREVISITQPKLFIAENVKGLTNLKDVKEIIEKDFSSVCNGGYLVVPAKVLNAAEYGVPQGRERVIFFGFKRSELRKEAREALEKEVIDKAYDPYPERTHYLSECLDGIREPYVSVREALAGLEEPEDTKDINQKKYSKAKYMGRHCQGQQEVKLDGVGPTIRSEHHGNIEYRRLSKEHGGVYEEELESGLPERRLTIRECARIQTFPDEFSFVIPAMGEECSVSASEAYKIIGNAVPPLLAYHIAKNIEEKWELYFGKQA